MLVLEIIPEGWRSKALFYDIMFYGGTIPGRHPYCIYSVHSTISNAKFVCGGFLKLKTKIPKTSKNVKVLAKSA